MVFVLSKFSGVSELQNDWDFSSVQTAIAIGSLRSYLAKTIMLSMFFFPRAAVVEDRFHGSLK